MVTNVWWTDNRFLQIYFCHVYVTTQTTQPAMYNEYLDISGSPQTSKPTTLFPLNPGMITSQDYYIFNSKLLFFFFVQNFWIP